MEKVMDELKLAEAKQGRLANLMNELDSKTSLLRSVGLDWKDLDVHYGSIRKALLQKAQEIEESEKRSELRELDAQVKQEEARVKLEAAHAVLDEATQKKKEIESYIQMKEKELGEIADGMVEIRSLMRKCSDDLELKEKECVGRIEAKDKLLDELQVEVSRKRDELRELDKSIALRHVDVERLDNLISYRRSKLKARGNHLAEVKSSIMTLNADCESKSDLLGSLERKIDEKEGELSSVVEELQDKQQQLEFVKNELAVGITQVLKNKRQKC
ncbi:hypothetical protein LINGRAHAP2_LOCUS13301 [Linum grandiflorum]